MTVLCSTTGQVCGSFWRLMWQEEKWSANLPTAVCPGRLNTLSRISHCGLYGEPVGKHTPAASRLHLDFG